MRDKVAQNITINPATMSTSASIIPTNILQLRSTTFTLPVPLPLTMPFSSPDGLSHLTTTIAIGTVDTATNVRASAAFPQTPNAFDQNQPHQSMIDEGNDISFPSSFRIVIYHVTIMPS